MTLRQHDTSFSTYEEAERVLQDAKNIGNAPGKTTIRFDGDKFQIVFGIPGYRDACYLSRALMWVKAPASQPREDLRDVVNNVIKPVLRYVIEDCKQHGGSSEEITSILEDLVKEITYAH
jgi:hypothetical protein